MSQTTSARTAGSPVPPGQQQAPRHVPDESFLAPVPSRALLVGSFVLALAYVAMICFAFQRGNALLFWLLVVTEVFHLAQLAGYCHTVWGRDRVRPFAAGFAGGVDVFITVCGEPVDVVRETALAALAMRYPGPVRIALLNDGLVAKKADWRDVEVLAAELGIECFTRTTPGGAKAGNINHALRRTENPFVVVFDADHVPHDDFLLHVMGYFTDEKTGFVQTPQYYKNFDENRVTRTSWQQQTLFFGPIMSGKSRLDAAFLCGTNMAIRRTALEQVGGMCEENIAEDFLTSLFLHEKGWRSVYVPKVLAQGLAPDDFLNYYKQQFRWTRGSLEVIFKYNPLLRRGLSFSQKVQYLTSASYYLSGAVVLAGALLPIIFLLTGQTPIVTSTMVLALVFVPYLWLNLAVLQRTSNASYSFQAIAFSLSAWWLQLSALTAVLLQRRTSFVVTSKAVGAGGQPNFLRLVVPQLAYVAVALVALAVGLAREGVSASLMANTAWLSVHVAISLPFIAAAAPRRAATAPGAPAAGAVLDLRELDLRDQPSSSASSVSPPATTPALAGEETR